MNPKFLVFYFDEDGDPAIAKTNDPALIKDYLDNADFLILEDIGGVYKQRIKDETVEIEEAEPSPAESDASGDKP